MHESNVERQIREAMEAGEFDHLPGAGRPIPGIDRPYDPAWWARSWMQREGLKEQALQLAARLRRSLPRILASDDDAAVEEALHALNAEIDSLNADVDKSDHLDLLDVELLLKERRMRWR